MSDSVAVAASSTPVADSAPGVAEKSQVTNELPANSPPQPPKPEKKKFKYKADGADVEEELDEAEVGNRLSLAKAAQKRMQEAANVQRQTKAFYEALQKDPLSVLTDPKIMGSEKFQQLAEQFLSKKLAEQMLTPEERVQQEKEARLAKYEQEEVKRNEEANQAKAKQLEDHYAKQYEQTIMTALQSSSLPKNPFTVKRMAELMQKNIRHGLDLEPQALAQLVKEDYQAELRHLISGANPEAILGMFGEDLSNKIRKHDLSKFQFKNPAPKPGGPAAPQESRQKMSPREYTEYLKNKFAK
jgi:hypothetical protein